MPLPADDAAPPSPPTLAARARAWWAWAAAQGRAHPWRAGLAGGGAALLALAATTLTWWGCSSARPRATPWEECLAALDAGELPKARRLAGAIGEQPDLPFEQLGGPLYVLGAAAAADAARELNPGKQRQFHLLAAKYLHEARWRGFPKGREKHGLLLLGESQFRSGDSNGALPVLRAAREACPERTRELLELLALASAAASPPQWEQALAYQQQRLRLADLTADQRAETQTHLAALLLELARDDECEQALAALQADAKQAAAAQLLRARLWIRQAERMLEGAAAAPPEETPAPEELPPEARDKLTRASQALAEITRGEPPADVARVATYLRAHCLARLGDRAGARDLFAQLWRSHFETPDGWAAGWEEANLLRRDGRRLEALAAYRRLLAALPDPGTPHNRWLPPIGFRQSAQAAVEDYLRANEFEGAVTLAEAAEQVLTPERSLELRARGHREWGRFLLRAAREKTGEAAFQAEAAAREQARLAGARHRELARRRFGTRLFTDDLWRAAESLAEGHDFSAAEAALLEYLRHARAAERPPALVALGEARLALRRPAEALAPLLECVAAHPKHPLAYQARLLAARVHEELNDWPAARAMLENNLSQQALTPRSQEWRDSLFSLGFGWRAEGLRLAARSRAAGVEGPFAASPEEGLRLLSESHDALRESIRVLTEAVERYPQAPQTLRAWYELAQAQRQSARWPELQARAARVETTQNILLAESRQALLAALQAYDHVRGQLQPQGEPRPLSAAEAATLRNTAFARGDVLYDLGRYEEAIEAYSSASNQYLESPAALSAFVQIARCQRQMRRPAEARGAIEQARVALEKMPADVDFKAVTPLTRDEWLDFLAWQAAL